mmetsp:Transcript_30181/g.87689  ORF Transcript_30181/g.87689 Transcript_30181/m.87689 type:complete len:588 (+) Transcript_30181:363-2126(+)
MEESSHADMPCSVCGKALKTQAASDADRLSFVEVHCLGTSSIHTSVYRCDCFWKLCSTPDGHDLGHAIRTQNDGERLAVLLGLCEPVSAKEARRNEWADEPIMNKMTASTLRKRDRCMRMGCGKRHGAHVFGRSAAPQSLEGGSSSSQYPSFEEGEVDESYNSSGVISLPGQGCDGQVTEVFLVDEPLKRQAKDKRHQNKSHRLLYKFTAQASVEEEDKAHGGLPSRHGPDDQQEQLDAQDMELKYLKTLGKRKEGEKGKAQDDLPAAAAVPPRRAQRKKEKQKEKQSRRMDPTSLGFTPAERPHTADDMGEEKEDEGHGQGVTIPQGGTRTHAGGNHNHIPVDRHNQPQLMQHQQHHNHHQQQQAFSAFQGGRMAGGMSGTDRINETANVWASMREAKEVQQAVEQSKRDVHITGETEDEALNRVLELSRQTAQQHFEYRQQQHLQLYQPPAPARAPPKAPPVAPSHETLAGASGGASVASHGGIEQADHDEELERVIRESYLENQLEKQSRMGEDAALRLALYESARIANVTPEVPFEAPHHSGRLPAVNEETEEELAGLREDMPASYGLPPPPSFPPPSYPPRR